jgi:two-component system sensor histidine kinase DesK
VSVANVRDRGARFVWAWAAVWLVFMINPIQKAWHRPELWQRALGIGAVLVFSALYIVTFLQLRKTIRARLRRFDLGVSLGIFGLMLALSTVLALAVGQAATGSLVYLVVMAIFLFNGKIAWSIVAGIAGLVLLVPRVLPGWKPDDGLAITLVTVAMAIWGIMHMVLRNAELAVAREEIARLAVADERSRFARDLHDLLGHSLTVVSVKAELASRLVAQDPERAEAELTDIQRLAREALADVRSAVGGYRDVSLGAELARARTALSSAGIDADLPSSVEIVPEDRQELFAWVVREGVTNVIRHSGAGRCTVRLSPKEISVTDDGKGPPASAGSGNGLLGLRERVTTVDGSLIVERAEEGGYALRIRVP